jgi:hypothetical protein
MGRLSGVGVNSLTRFPYDLGASASGEGGTTFRIGGTAAEVVVGVFFAAFSARRR